jgi:hypothetical protein
MVNQNSNNKAEGTRSQTCDPGMPIVGVDTANGVYVKLAMQSNGSVRINTEQDPISLASLGLWGSNYYLDTARTTSPLGQYYCCIQVITAAVLNVTAGNTREFDQNGADVDLAALSGLSIPAGTLLYGRYSKVVLISGHVKLIASPLF